MKKIYVSIASFVDRELYSTVDNLFRQARYPENVFVYILSQDEDHLHPDLTPIFEEFGIKEYCYEKVNYQKSEGLGWARNKTMSLLTKDFDYYLQIDSHTQFIDNWDLEIMYDYEKVRSVWGDCIISTYPTPYDYDEFDQIILDNDNVGTPMVKIVAKKEYELFSFEATYSEEEIDPNGSYTGYFCGGQDFGPAEYFMNIKPDPLVYFNGEEEILSIRFYEAGIKIICPPRTYVYHNYDGSRRTRHWEKADSAEYINKVSDIRIKNFINNRIPKDSPYGLKHADTYDRWVKEHVQDE